MVVESDLGATLRFSPEVLAQQLLQDGDVRKAAVPALIEEGDSNYLRRLMLLLTCLAMRMLRCATGLSKC